MATFDANSRVKRATPDPRTDHKLPHPASLSWDTITGQSALEGTVGHHCELVHGDHWCQVEGNVIQNIREDVTTHISGNHSHTISGNHSHSVMGDAQNMHLGTYTVTHVNSKIETYCKHRFMSMSSNTDLSYTDTTYQAYGLKVQMCAFQMQMNGWTINLITVPAVPMMIGAAGGTPATSSAGLSPEVGFGSMLGSIATGLALTLNSGFNLSTDNINLGYSMTFKGKGASLKADLAALDAKLFGGQAHAGAGAAGLAPNVGAPPHGPTMGKP